MESMTNYIPWSHIPDDYCDYWFERGGGKYEGGPKARGCFDDSDYFRTKQKEEFENSIYKMT